MEEEPLAEYLGQVVALDTQGLFLDLHRHP